jgi:SHAQKYF class myb-like DNA-binding protein
MKEEKEEAKTNFNITNFKNLQIKNSLNPNKMKQAENPVKFLTKKIGYFNVECLGKYSKKAKGKNITKEGRWSKEEQEKFLEGITLYGTNWKKIRSLVKTRNSIQVCSHAQKFFSRMKTFKDEELGLDFTLNSICSITDMVNQIKSISNNYNINEISKSLKNKINNKSNLNYENINKIKYINENFNYNDSTKLSTDINYDEISNNLLKKNNQNYNLSNILNKEKDLENIYKASLLNYYSNPYIDILINNYLKSNPNINNLLLSLLKEQNNIINTINIINSLNNNKNINQINMLENQINNNNLESNIFNNNLLLFNNNNSLNKSNE